jgi:hypothetical protein
MKKICMFENDPMNRAIGHTAAGSQLDTISVVTKCRILGTL